VIRAATGTSPRENKEVEKMKKRTQIAILSFAFAALLAGAAYAGTNDPFGIPGSEAYGAYGEDVIHLGVLTPSPAGAQAMTADGGSFAVPGSNAYSAYPDAAVNQSWRQPAEAPSAPTTEARGRQFEIPGTNAYGAYIDSLVNPSCLSLGWEEQQVAMVAGASPCN
jgi:hypothetical protein